MGRRRRRSLRQKDWTVPDLDFRMTALVAWGGDLADLERDGAPTRAQTKESY
jgi:hypothetical protein